MKPSQNHDNEGSERKQLGYKVKNEPQHHVEEEETSNDSTMIASVAAKGPTDDGSDPYFTEGLQTALTHGVLLGIGASFCVSATFVLPSQWFIKHRSLANGLGNMGVPFGDICFSPLTQYLLDTLGLRNALRTMGCILFLVFTLATILVRARYPPNPPQYRSTADDTQKSSPLLSIPFILFLVFITLAPFGYLIPFYLMPTYATQALGTSGSLGAAMVSVASASNCISRLVWGYAADRYGEMNTLIFTTGISSR